MFIISPTHKNVFVTPNQINAFAVIHGHSQSSKVFESPKTEDPAEVRQGSDLLPCFSFHDCEQEAFPWSIQCHSFILFVGDFPIQNSPQV